MAAMGARLIFRRDHDPPRPAFLPEMFRQLEQYTKTTPDTH
jgi:hypothetical protein